MIIYRFRPSDHVFDGAVEVPDSPKIPPHHTRTPPPEREGHYAVMRRGWVLLKGRSPADPAKASPAREQIEAQIVADTQRHLDDFARSRGYDGMLSLCTYATSTVAQFRLEGQYGVEARDATWAKLHEIFEAAANGRRAALNSFSDVVDDLPALVWPDDASQAG